MTTENTDAGVRILTKAIRKLTAQLAEADETLAASERDRAEAVNRLRDVRVKLTGWEGKGIGAVFARMAEDVTATLNGDFETTEELAAKRMTELAEERDRRRSAEEGQREARDRMAVLEERIEKALSSLESNGSAVARVHAARRALRVEA